MTVVNSKKDDPVPLLRKPATTPEAMQNRLIALAHEQAERQLLAGTASTQLITQLVKMGTKREEYEIEKLKQETTLTAAKVVAMESAVKAEELFERAMDSFRGYQPSMDDDIE